MDTIIHRGPDSEGSFTDESAALGFRRLSIIDLSERGDQPIYNEDSSKVLVFNGEIYNYQELRKELIGLGHTFTTNTDSETILHGYEEYGFELPEKLRGMFAFAIWDRNEKSLFAARDMFGIKPLYYAKQENTFFFGSEIKSFLPHPDFRREFNEDQLPNYLSFQFVPSDETFFKGVFCLKPGHHMFLKDGNLTITRWFEPVFQEDPALTPEKAAEEIDRVMRDSVRAHKISDVEVASYLSSGVDSSYLTFLGGVDRTFTVGFTEKAYSEIRDAKEFADQIGMKNDARIIEPDEYWDSLSDIMYYMDEPVADPSALALYFLSDVASKKVKVVLSGEGSDELFGGYNIYCEPLEHTRFNKIPFPVRRFLGRAAERILPRDTKGRGFLMRHGKTLEERYFSNATNIFTEREADRILRKGAKPGISGITAPLYERVRDKDAVTKMQYVDLHIWLVHDILMKGDKMGMAHSIEVRVPFLDREVMKLSQRLPLVSKVQAPRTKVALRMAAEKVIPEKTAEKKKWGFPIPLRVWMKDPVYYTRIQEAFSSEDAKRFFRTDLLQRLLSDHINGKRDNSRRIWTVYVFLVWYKRFFSGDHTQAA